MTPTEIRQPVTSRVYRADHPAAKVRPPRTQRPWVAWQPPVPLAVLQAVLDGLKNL